MSIFRYKRTYPTGERDIASPPSSGVSHIADLVAQVAARNAEEMMSTETAQARSPVRKVFIPEAAEIFTAAMVATRSSREDVAAALDLSSTIVTGWTSGRRSIPSDCVLGAILRHPDFGTEILCRCAARLDLMRLRRLTGRMVALLGERESESESEVGS